MIRRLLPVLVVLSIWIVLPGILPRNLTDLLVFAGIYTIAGLGVSLLLGHCGIVNLAQALFYGIGAYATAWYTAVQGGKLVGLDGDIINAVAKRLGLEVEPHTDGAIDSKTLDETAVLVIAHPSEPRWERTIPGGASPRMTDTELDAIDAWVKAGGGLIVRAVLPLVREESALEVDT